MSSRDDAWRAVLVLLNDIFSRHEVLYAVLVHDFLDTEHLLGAWEVETEGIPFGLLKVLFRDTKGSGRIVRGHFLCDDMSAITLHHKARTPRQSNG